VVDDDRVGDHQVAVRRAHQLVERALILPVADRFAAAEDRLLAVVGVVVLDLDEELGVRQPDTVTDGWPVFLCGWPSRKFNAHEPMPPCEFWLWTGARHDRLSTVCGRIRPRCTASGWSAGCTDRRGGP